MNDIVFLKYSQSADPVETGNFILTVFPCTPKFNIGPNISIETHTEIDL